MFIFDGFLISDNPGSCSPCGCLSSSPLQLCQIKRDLRYLTDIKVITAHRSHACYVPLTIRTCVFIGLRASRQVVHCLICIMQLIIRFMRLLFGLGSRVSVCSVLRDPDRQSAYS